MLQLSSSEGSVNKQNSYTYTEDQRLVRTAPLHNCDPVIVDLQVFVLIETLYSPVKRW